jgi:hypothetical protein
MGKSSPLVHTPCQIQNLFVPVVGIVEIFDGIHRTLVCFSVGCLFPNNGNMIFPLH